MQNRELLSSCAPHTHRLLLTLAVHAVYQLLAKQPRKGLGHQLQRATWPEDSFWTISRVRLDLVRPCKLCSSMLRGPVH